MSNHDTADYARLKSAFFELLDLDDAERAARLAQIEAESSTLAAALRRQLEAAGQSLPLLDRATDAPSAPQLPQYRVLRELGRGGMGVVWLAERSLGDARQTVALKQIAHLHWSEDDLRRFQRERRILASLDHPNIAALVDGGTDERGDAFLATQYVEGERLDRWCQAQGLNLRARIALLRQIAAAVAYAHGKLVVHRDLKPANILVTLEGAPKLLDFGIARVLHEEAVTTEGPSQMTLRYAAPEQVASDGAEGGVSIDVYALGVLLYELLAQVSPYGDASGPAALMHAILQLEPTPPSHITTAIAGVDADLDAICLKALRKRPQERYASANEVLADLDRWLDREPVEARRGERGYRLRTFVRRRWQVLAVLVALVLTGVGFAAYEVHSSRAQIAALKLERDKARAISHFFDELFATATPDEVLEGSVTARELLKRAASRLEQGSTAKMPDDALGSLYKAAGTVMVRQNLLPEAGLMLDHAISLWRGLPAPPIDDLSGAMHERARISYIQGQAEAAIELEQQAVALLEDRSDADQANYAAILNALAVMQWTSGKSEAAMATLERAAVILRAQLPEGRLYYANNLRNLAMFQLYSGKAATGLVNAQEAVTQIQQLKPERTRDLLANRGTVAAALRELGRFEEADALYSELAQRMRTELGANSQDLADLLNSHAKLLLLQQQWERADAVLREVEAIHVGNGGENHPRALAARADRALIAIGQEQWNDALQALEAVARLRADGGRIEPSTLAGEQVALAYAACRAVERPTSDHAQALRDAIVALQRNPTLPRARLAQAESWGKECEARQAETPH